MLLETQFTKRKLITCRTFPCRDVAWISTKTHNFEQKFTTFTILLS